MEPELEYLLARCGVPFQVEEYEIDILSTSSCDLTARLNEAIRNAQANSAIFPRMDKNTWYMVAPETTSDIPRCLIGKTFIMAIIIFPDFESPPASCPKKEREEFEKTYVRTFFEKLQAVHNYTVALARTHELREVSDDLLTHARELLELSIFHAQREHDVSVAAEKRLELSQNLKSMQSCRLAIISEEDRRHKEKCST